MRVVSQVSRVTFFQRPVVTMRWSPVPAELVGCFAYVGGAVACGWFVVEGGVVGAGEGIGLLCEPGLNLFDG